MKHFALKREKGLLSEGITKDVLHLYERIPVNISETENEASQRVASRIIEKINEKGGQFKIGFSAGTSPVAILNKLYEAYKNGEVSFKNVVFIGSDEFYPYSSIHSRMAFLRKFVEKVDLKKENIFLPDANTPIDKIDKYCLDLDEVARECDMWIMGIGEQGQIAFNEAGTSAKSKTRTVLLSYLSRKRQARYFGGELNATPENAISVGISTILSAKEICLLAWGEDKADIVRSLTEDEPTSIHPASLLQRHDKIRFYTDKDASSKIIRVVSPWLVGHCEWTDRLMRIAVVWLSQKVNKPVLKLTHQDYLENSLGELLHCKGAYYDINIRVFNDLQHTITGWPGGKPNADDSTRPVPSLPEKKNVIIFSPHPDDDVISMGGTLIRLSDHGHNVHVAYETSGNFAVHDDVVVQQLDAARELGLTTVEHVQHVKQLIASKKPGEAEPRELLDLKGSIRRSEAKAALRSTGMDDKRAHFLNLPFYETGGVKKNPSTQADIDIVKALLQEIEPDQIYMAGDLADPHGTHRVCTETVLAALEQLQDEPWMKTCHGWLYRGAWMEWEPGVVDMAVPLSPSELIRKRHAIFRHVSQKDIVPFPGDDSREFWQRAEDRTQNTAKLYDSLGMAEYQAIELFVKLF
ncbi:MAG: glucosamine-6-phosphate deaminase [Bacteroidales bacterium]|nr:glucosamine-6-phosphate deaminase [Bacteroidales bacterium]